MIRYGILGFGLHAVRRLMPGFAEASHCTVTGLWRRDQRKAEEALRQYPQFPIQVYDSPEALCSASDVDAIFVASPDALHLKHVLVALEHRKPVLCEKPMASSLSGARIAPLEWRTPPGHEPEYLSRASRGPMQGRGCPWQPDRPD